MPRPVDINGRPPSPFLKRKEGEIDGGGAGKDEGEGLGREEGGETEVQI